MCLPQPQGTSLGMFTLNTLLSRDKLVNLEDCPYLSTLRILYLEVGAVSILPMIRLTVYSMINGLR